MTPAQANASQKMSYTFSVSFDNLYSETSSFAPPAKLNKLATQKLVAQVCQAKVNKQPRVTIRSASGKIVGSGSLYPNHSIKSATWVTDPNGENVFRIVGSCSFAGLIPRKYATSNFYQFSADPSKIINWQTWSYPYTPRQLSTLKGGINETRLIEGDGANSFFPYPEIETPKLEGVRCLTGNLKNYDDYENVNGENVDVAIFNINNPVYKKREGEVNWPHVWLSGARAPKGENYEVQYFDPDTGGGALVSNSSGYMVWKKPSEKSFEIELGVSVYMMPSAEKYKVVNEKMYSLAISGDCKTQSLKLR